MCAWSGVITLLMLDHSVAAYQFRWPLRLPLLLLLPQGVRSTSRRRRWGERFNWTHKKERRDEAEELSLLITSSLYT